MREPDYENLTLEALIDVHKHIDKDAHPERFKRIEEILNNPKKLEKLEATQVRMDRVKIEKRKEEKVALNGIVLLFYGIMILSFGFAFTRYGAVANVESTPFRIILGCTFLVVGYLYFKKHFGNK